MSWNPVTSLILKKEGNAIVNFAKKKKKSNVLLKIHMNQRCVLQIILNLYLYQNNIDGILVHVCKLITSLINSIEANHRKQKHTD